MKRLFFLILFLPVLLFGQSVSTSIKTDRIYSKIGRGIGIYDTIFLKKGTAPDSLYNIGGVVCRNTSDGRLVYIPFSQFNDSIGGITFSGDTIFGGGDTLIVDRNWTKTANDIQNNNTGKVILPDSLYANAMHEANKVYWIMGWNNTTGRFEKMSPTSLGDGIDSARAASPTAYTQWVRDSTGLILSLAHTTDTVEIGNTLRFSNNEFAIFKNSNTYYFAGATLKTGTGGYSLIGGYRAFYLATGFGGGNVVLGGYAGSESDSVSSSVMIGYYAGYLANLLGNSVLLGQRAGQYSRVTSGIFLGYNAGGLGFTANNCEGNYLFGAGYEALSGNKGSDVNGIGQDAAFENLGNNVNAFGNGAADDNTGNDVNLLGRLIGVGNTGDDVNWIGSTHADHSSQYNTASCVNIIGSWDTTNYNTIQPGRTYLGGDLELFQPFEDSCGTGFGSKIYAENNELEMMGDFIIDDSLFLNSKADAFIVSDGNDLKIENAPAEGDISIIGYTSSTGVQAFHFDGDAGKIGIGTNAPSNDIDLTGNVDVNGEMDMTGGDIDNADTVTAAYINVGCDYTIPVFSGTLATPIDATTYYFGGLSVAGMSTAAAARPIRILKAGTITAVQVINNSTTAGSGEAWAMYIRKNNTTDYGIDTVSSTANLREWTNYSMSVPVAAGDYVEIKMVTPTWATDPVTVVTGGYIYIKQ